MNASVHNFGMQGVAVIDAHGHAIRYFEQGAGWRYATLLDKEPETIAWIDGFAPGDTFWDVGANVGIYSVYAAARGIRTFGFEPHFANYHQFCATIALNDLADRVTPLCLAFAEQRSVSTMNLASTDIGTSMSSFGSALDFRGHAFAPAFRQGMIGYDIDGFIADFAMEVPNHLKVDVDGIELAIIKGARRTLADPRLKSVSIELIESDAAQVEAVSAILIEAGLQFVHKKQNAAFATPETRDVLNYLFHRDPASLGRSSDDAEQFTASALVDRIVARIAAAPIDPEPCANLTMADMLPPVVYRELLARLPDDAALDPIVHPDAVAADGRVTRHLLDLVPASLDRFAADDRAFWDAMIAVFTAPAIADAIVAKFAPTLHARFGETLPELVAVPILYRDHPGYRIGVHPDAPSKIATMQFYLPADDSQAHLGTAFHRRVADGFERLKTNVFAPNSAYAFVRTDESWHSVDELGDDEAPRNSIALTFYIKGEEYRSRPAPVMPEALTELPYRCSDFYGPEMSAALGQVARSFTRRDEVASLFREGGVGAELGVAAGDFSARVLDYAHIGYLYSIDMWSGDRGHGVEQYREAIARLHPYRDRNALMRMRFDEALPLFADETFDFLYVDGYAHDGELEGRTFRDWFPKLKPGGIIAGDDYSPDWPLVVKAVDAFCAEHGLELHVIQCGEQSWNSKYPTWFAMKP